VSDLNFLSLSRRIATCPQLNNVHHLYPDVPKETVLAEVDEQERTQPHPVSMVNGYVGADVIMVARMSLVHCHSVGVCSKKLCSQNSLQLNEISYI
jgi:hypothetical protein